MEAQSPLVGTNGAVEFDAEPSVGVHVPGIVGPRHAEHDDALGFYDALKDVGILVLGVVFHEGNDGLGHFLYRLQKFGFVGVAFGNPIHERLDRGVVF